MHRHQTVNDQHSANSDRDPLVICWAIAGVFYALALVRLDVPSFRYFDEYFYVPTAARLILGIDVSNREHPMLAKELMGIGLALFGNQPLGWRIGSAVAGALGLFCAARAMWWYSASRTTTIVFGLLLASHGLLFSLSRIALLDVYMFAFAAFAVMLFAQGKFPMSGIAFGLALACKWSVIPLLAIFALMYLWRERSWRPFVHLGVLPLAAYFLTFVPGMFVRDNPLTLADLIPMQLEMASYLAIPFRPHPYQSVWWQWALNFRPLWLFHAPIDGTFRIGIMGGNAVSSFALLPAVAWGLVRRNPLAIIYVLLLGFWALSGKPIQYYYHYLLAATFGLALLSQQIAVTRLGLPIVGAALLGFAWLYPALTGAQARPGDEARYSWQPGWYLNDSWAAANPSPAPASAITARPAARSLP